jgi:hypothetical protein
MNNTLFARLLIRLYAKLHSIESIEAKNISNLSESESLKVWFMNIEIVRIH